MSPSSEEAAVVVRKRITYFPVNRSAAMRWPYLTVVMIVSLLSVLIGLTLV
jgi:hypothetical protein